MFSFICVCRLTAACFKLSALTSTPALSRARSVSMDALMTRYLMLSEALAGAVAKYHSDIK